MTDRIALASTVREPVTQVLDFVHFHQNRGIDHHFVYFDDPDDPAAAAVAEIDGVSAIRCDAAYWAGQGVAADAAIETRQLSNLGDAMRRARADGYDWLGHVDADELIYCDPPIATFLSSVSDEVDQVWLAIREAVPPGDRVIRPFTEVTEFKVVPRGRYKRLVGMVRFLAGKRGVRYINGPPNGKSFIRTRCDAALDNVHRSLRSDGEPLNTVRVRDQVFLHFAACGYASWETKWQRRVDGVGVCDDLGAWEMRQLELFAACLASGNQSKLRDLYRQVNCLSSFERFCLKRLGQLREVRLDPALFTPRQR